jgi:hypothetical protein
MHREGSGPTRGLCGGCPPAAPPVGRVGGMSVGVLRDTMVAIGLVLLLPLVVIVIGAPVVLLVRLLLAIFE